MAIVDDSYIIELERLKNKLVGIANRYLPNEERLDENATLNDVANVLDEYDEYTYMNAFLNSIEVFPDKDYSINDTRGHIKGLRSGALQNNTALRSVYLGGCTVLPTYAFNNCTNLNYLYLGEITSIPQFAFANCGGDLYLPKVVTTSRHSFHSSDQGGGAALITSIYAPKLVNFGLDLFFKNCQYLKNINFASFTNIGGNNFFQNTLSLVTVLLGGTGTIINNNNNNVHEGTHIILTHQHFVSLGGSTVATSMSNANVYVPASLLTTYQEGTNWVTVHASRPIQDIESNINSLRELGADFSYTPYANKKWENNQLVSDPTIGEEVDE